MRLMISSCLNGRSDINGGSIEMSAHDDLRLAKHKITQSITDIPGGTSIIAFETSRLRFEELSRGRQTQSSPRAEFLPVASEWGWDNTQH